MKHTKKLIAFGAACTLAMSSMTAFASDLEIGGDINYVNTTVYKLTLPTSAGLNFTLDPQGLTSLDSGTYSNSEAGKIIAETPFVAKNESSVDVKLSASFYLEDSSDSDGATFAESVTDEGKKQVALTITDDKDSTVAKITGTSGTPTTQSYTMEKATYTFAGNKTSGYKYELTPDSGSTLKLTIGGNVAKDADWSAYTGADAETITLHASFKFTTTDDKSLVSSIAGAAYSRAASDNTYTITWADAVASDKKTIKSIVVSSDGVTFSSANAIPADAYSLDSDTITLKIDGTKNTTIGAGGVGKTRYLKVTFGDDSTAIITVNVAA